MSSYGARRQPFDSDGCVTAIGWGVLWIIVLAFVLLIGSWFFTSPQWCTDYAYVDSFEERSVGFAGKEKFRVTNKVCVDVATGHSPAEVAWKNSVDFVKQRW